MPAFLVALMVVALVVLGLTAVLLLTRTMRKEAAAVERVPRRPDSDDGGPSDAEPATSTPPEPSTTSEDD